jgi:polygalacturonase
MKTLKHFMAAVAAAIPMAVTSFSATAQDMRNVTEPRVPPVCITLTASLEGANGINPKDETRLDTARIQMALDQCGQGRAVELVRNGARTAFLSGPLQMKKGVTLLVEKGVTLYASRDPRLFDLKPGACGIVNMNEKAKSGCLPLIKVKRANNSGFMGQGTIDGRGGSKLLLNGVDGPESWWEIAEDARKAGHQEVPRLIEADHTDNLTLYQIELKNSPNVHVSFQHGNGMTVWGVRIDTQKLARNADGINPSSSRNVTITQSYIRAGDDNVAIKAGSGKTRDISIVHNHFYWGHGMSIGSETNSGVNGIYISDLSVDGADNGLRIKSNPSRGGLVREVIYDNVCIRNSKAPIFMDTAYNKPGDTKSKQPVYRDIVLHNVRVSGGGKIQLLGLDATHRIGVQFDGVVLADPNAKYKFMANHSDITLGPGPVNFQLSGEDSTVKGTLGPEQKLPSCDAMFVPFPADTLAPVKAPPATVVADKK